MKHSLRALISLGAALFMLLPTQAPASAAAQVETLNIKVDGVADMYGSNCPFRNWVPSTTTICEDWRVFFLKENLAAQVQKTPWAVLYLKDTWRVFANGNADLLQDISGYTENVTGFFDDEHLTQARVTAAVPMSDGTTRKIDLAWDGTSSPLKVAGNNGPFNTTTGTPRHVSTGCETFNNNAHQTYRANVAVAGSVDGVDPRSLPYEAPFEPLLARGEFTVIGVTHGSCV